MICTLALIIVATASSTFDRDPPIWIVDLSPKAALNPADVLAVQVCAGLMNRGVNATPVYTTWHEPEDTVWLTLLDPAVASTPPTPVPEFLAACFDSQRTAGYIRFNFSAQQALVPNLITLAAVLNAVPVEDGASWLPVNTPRLFDAIISWAGFSALNATRAMYTLHARNTTALAKMNPGLDVHQHPVHPTLTGLPDLSLTDYIVKERLFNFYLNEGCIAGTQEHALMEEMASQGPWTPPLAVFGYDDTFPVAGDLFEAETLCVEAHNMGQIATTGVNNLAFFSRTPPGSTPLATNTAPMVSYNRSRTYLALVVGDGDNVAFVKSTRFQWFTERLAACANGTGCFPLLWSLSPHLAYLAPGILQWFNTAARTTGADFFVLPPSGHLYAYPGSMPPAVQSAFVAATENDCVLYNTSASVEWEFAGTWAAALAAYLPQYAARNIVRGFFCVNVPYLLPTPAFGPHELFRVLNNSVVAFAPNEWRGTGGGAQPGLHPFTRSAAEMAAQLGALPPGSVTAVYLTSDGGGSLRDLYDLVPLLAEHVQVVNHEALVALALAAHAQHDD